MRTSFGALLAFLAAFAPVPSEASGGARQVASLTAGKPRSVTVPLGRSLGSPTEGRLTGGARIEEAAHLRIVPLYAQEDVRWGLGSLVQLVDRGARAVRRQYPDAVLTVGHLSREHGGEIDHHASHESGRDADVLFYVKGVNGKPLLADRFVPFRGDGTADSWPGAHFDDARNWAFVQTLLSEGEAHVTHIFVASPLRTRLLQYAARIGAPAAVRERAAEVMAQPRGALPHDDHFHVRISCPASQRAECVETPVVHGPRLARKAPGHVLRPEVKRLPPPLPRIAEPARPSAPRMENEPEPQAPAAAVAAPLDDGRGVEDVDGAGDSIE